MKTAREVKKLLKDLGYNTVRVNTVAVKSPFYQFRLPGKAVGNEYHYEQTFTNKIREFAVLCEYNIESLEDFKKISPNFVGVRDPHNICYGNTTSVSFSLDQRNSDRFYKLVSEFYAPHLLDKKKDLITKVL